MFYKCIYDDEKKYYFHLKVILLILLLFLNKGIIVKIKIIKSDGQNYNMINSKVSNLIKKLNRYEFKRIPKYILFFDYINSPICSDTNSYNIFQVYQRNNDTDAYYVINEKTELYNSLLKNNQTQNIIPFIDYKHIDTLFPYLLNSKIIVQSYALYEFQIIISKVNYLKFLYLCHAVNYFKKQQIKIELLKLEEKKKHIIITSPYEYDLYIKMKLYNKTSMHIAGLSRYERFSNKKTNHYKEKNCILTSFTYRSYNNSIYIKSLFRNNLVNLFKDASLLSYLEQKNINLIYIPHHHDEIRNRSLKKEEFPKIMIEKQESLSYYIEKCSLFITDFSSISFDFMFQNKPVLFYFLDINDKFDFLEKSYMKIEDNNNIFFKNIFYEKDALINNIKYFVDRKFELTDGLSKKYKTLFYNKNNIINKIINVINKIIESK